MTTHSHHDNVEKQFGSQANAYLTSTVHATGRDLQRLAQRLSAFPLAHVLDMGCGAGHASFIAAQNVHRVVAYDLSSQMLEVVAQAASEKGLNNISTRQGYAEKLPFDDHAFDVVISRYSAHHWHDVGMALREVCRVLKPGGRLIMMDVMSPGIRFVTSGCRRLKRCVIPRMCVTIQAASGCLALITRIWSSTRY